MTYCLGIKVKQGLVALSDTRITSGSESTTSKKISTHTIGQNRMFIMTSGLRSIRDKAVIYFEEIIEEQGINFTKMHEAVNAFGGALRRVSNEDRMAITQSGLFFNLNSIVGGKLKDDKEHKLFLLYPEGNWIEISEATPFCIIGNSGFGTPILRRALNTESDLRFALKTGLLSFDSTRVSANDVGYPIDVVVFNKDTNQFIEQRFGINDLTHVTGQWADALKSGIDSLPENWMDGLVAPVNQQNPWVMNQQQQQQQQFNQPFNNQQQPMQQPLQQPNNPSPNPQQPQRPFKTNNFLL